MQSCLARVPRITGGILLLALLMSFVVVDGPVSSDPLLAKASRPSTIPDHIVILNSGSDADDVAASHSLAIDGLFSHSIQGFVTSVPEGRLNALRRDSRVTAVEENIILQVGPTSIFDVLPTSSQTIPTGVRRIGAIDSPVARIDGVDDRVPAIVAVMDTGVDGSHPDLNVNVSASIDCSSGSFCVSGIATDDLGHGTHVAGTIAALDNSIGVVGVAPGAEIWSIRVCSPAGGCPMSAILMGHDYITANSDSIDVVNLSLGGLGWSDTWRQAVDDNVAAGVVVVVAAGNATRDIYGSDGSLGNGNEHLPAAFPGSLTVSALSDSDGLPGGAGYDSTYGVDDTLTGFTNFGNSVVSNNPITSPGGAIDVAAPGALIQSTMPGNSTGWMSGTSMASPHVAGVVALHIAATGPAKNDADVVAIRQAIVDAGSPMNAWRPDDLDLESDNDSLHEPLVSGAVGYTTSLMSDLAMTASLDNYDALPGDSVIATAIVENTGNVVFDYPARVIITSDNGTPDDPSDDVVLMEQQVPAGLLPGSQVALVTNVETTNLAPGSFVVTAAHLAIDDRPGNNSSSQTLTVTSPPSSPVEPGKVSIEPVTWWSEGGKNRDRHLRLSMTLLDGVAAAVEGAVISVSITHESGKTKVLSGNSGTDGNVEFRINGAVAGLYTLIVTNLSHELNDWDGEQPSNAAFTKP